MTEDYVHPAFPQPKDTAATLWRYMDGWKFEWLLQWGRLFMPSADRLGDPFEGTRPVGDLEWWARAAERAVSEEQRRILQHNSDLQSRFARGFRDHYYVSCWHVNQYENHAMWRCYTTQPTAVAIRTTYSILRQCLPEHIEMGMVRYIDYTEERMPSMNLFEYITHKEAYYRFENEARAVALPPVDGALGERHFRENHFEMEASPGFRVFAPPVDLRLLILGVVLHPESSTEFKAKVSELCATQGVTEPIEEQLRLPQYVTALPSRGQRA